MYEDHQTTKSSEEEGHVVTNFSDNMFGSASSSPTGTVKTPDFKLSTFLNPNFSYIIPVCSHFQNPNFSKFFFFFLHLKKLMGFSERRVWDGEHDGDVRLVNRVG